MEKIRKYIFLVIIILVFTLLSFLLVFKQSYTYDEFITFQYTESSFFNIIKNSLTYDYNFPFYYVLAKVISLFSNSLLSIRLLSFLFGIISILIFFNIAQHYFFKKNSLIASLSTFVYSINITLIYLSANARSYSLMIVLFNIFLLFACKYIKDNSKKNFLFLTFSGILLCLSHYVGILFFLPIYMYLLYFFVKNNELSKKFIFFLIGVFVLLSIFLCIQFIHFFIDTLGGFWVPQIDLSYINYSLKRLWGSRILHFSFIFFFVIYYCKKIKTLGKKIFTNPSNEILAFISISGTLVLFVIISLVRSIFFTRYLSPFIVLFYLVGGLFFVSMKKKTIMGLIVFCTVILLSFISYLGIKDIYYFEEWDLIFTDLIDSISNESKIDLYFIPSNRLYTVEYYLNRYSSLNDQVLDYEGFDNTIDLFGSFSEKQLVNYTVIFDDDALGGGNSLDIYKSIDNLNLSLIFNKKYPYMDVYMLKK